MKTSDTACGTKKKQFNATERFTSSTKILTLKAQFKVVADNIFIFYFFFFQGK